jgi:hypothetical protein
VVIIPQSNPVKKEEKNERFKFEKIKIEQIAARTPLEQPLLKNRHFSP